MGVTTRDIFGSNGSGEAASPGSYGRPPSGFRLPAAAAPGPVRLKVADLERSRAFYRRTLGLNELSRDGASAVLGVSGAEEGGGRVGAPLVALDEQPGARPARARGRLGLFHFAILLPDRAALGRFLGHLEAIGVRAGAADHLVSEALYLSDPDGLGIEVYADRPRERWRRIGRELVMATDPLDLESLKEAAGGAPWTGMPAGTVMGHVHLHVGDLVEAARFYSAALGLGQTVWSYPGALFLAAGGYHHHLGTNLWAGPAARPPEADEAQLLEWTLELPYPESLAEAADSLRQAGYPAEATEEEGGIAILTRDSWGTQLRLRGRSSQKRQTEPKLT